MYKPTFRRFEPEEKEVQIWSAGSVASLQACFECTDWDCFYESCDDIDDLCYTIPSYISFCVNLNIPKKKKVVVYPNNKPWITKELKTVINKKKRSYFIGSLLEKKDICREVEREITKAKIQYKSKIETKLGTGNMHTAWQELKSMACINKRYDNSKQHFKIEGILDSE